MIRKVKNIFRRRKVKKLDINDPSLSGDEKLHKLQQRWGE